MAATATVHTHTAHPLLAPPARLRQYVDREVVAGLRPGQLTAAAATADPATPATGPGGRGGVVGQREEPTVHPPGSAPAAGEDAAGAGWTARLDASVSVRTGDQIEVMADLANAHFFDPDTTEAIPADVVVTADEPAVTTTTLPRSRWLRHAERARAEMARLGQLPVVELKPEQIDHPHHAGHRLGELHRELRGRVPMGAAHQCHHPTPDLRGDLPGATSRV